MNEATVAYNQSILDLSIQTNGTFEACVQLAFENDVRITDMLEAGDKVKTVQYELADNDVANYYNRFGLMPSTALTDLDLGLLENNDPCDLCKCFT